MVVYEHDKGCSGKVKFISYDGKYPNLCSGALKLEIDGEIVEFKPYGDCFWCSGGGVSWDYNSTYRGEWVIHYEGLPDKYKQYADEIDKVFNENVEFGCCGGCI